MKKFIPILILLTATGSPGLPAQLSVHFWFTEDLDSRWLTIPGRICLLILLVTALSATYEREQSRFTQLLPTPLHPSSILIGESGLLQAALIIAMGAELTGGLLLNRMY